MGSMFEVMKKIRKADAAAEAAAARSPSADEEGTTGSEAGTVDAATGTVTPPPPEHAGDNGSGVAPGIEADEHDIVVREEAVKWARGKIDPAVIAFHDRYSPICERYRATRARLLSMNPQGMHQIIAITSSIPQEGKSVTTANLGLVMAESGEHKVCVLDADFRRSTLGRMLGCDRRPGLAEVFRGKLTLTEALIPTPFPNLKILGPGNVTAKSYTELLSTPTARDVLSRLRAAFDYTLLDTPPVNTVSDVSMLAPHCDGALVVVEMRRTPEPAVQQAVRTLQANNVKLLGCLLSRFADHRTRYYDRYYDRYYQRNHGAD